MMKMAIQKINYSNYYVSGECADHGWLVKNQELFESEMREEMRRNGYIPVLDIPTTFTWEYDTEREVCKFQAVAKGWKVGRRKSKAAMGIISEEGILVGADAKSVQALVTV